MRFRPILVTLPLVLALGSITTPLNAETFITNLTTGSTGVEVSALQQILVAEGYLVMPAGVSYGYFGPLTKAAVAKWQVANNVSPTLGYFGPISRATLARKTKIPSTTTPEPPTNPIADTQPSPSPIETTSTTYNFSSNRDTPFALGMKANTIILFRASPFEVRPGDFITLDGSGFSKTSNKVYFDGGNEVIATSTNGIVMDVVVPTNLSEGERTLSVANVFGSSDNPNSNIKIKIRVTNNPQPPPTITGASIVGDSVTVVGTGFTSSNNLFTTFGNSSNPIFSNGTTFNFRISNLSMYEKIKKFTQGRYQASLWIYVQNEHGMNKDPYQLVINI